MRRVAVVGAGISGLSAAYALTDSARVTLFEAGDYFGGHTHTVNLALDGVSHGVDTGFLVFNERTYPRLIALLAELGVVTAASDMSFSVQAPDIGLEWSGSSLNSVFAQRRNLLRPRFWRMLADLGRFNRTATAIALRNAESELTQSIGEFLAEHAFSTEFRDGYFLPMIGSIWSCTTEQMLSFPIATMIRFCHNHGLLQVTRRPRWFSIVGGAHRYVEKMLARVPDARLNTPVRRVMRRAGGGAAWVATDAGQERFDAVVLACHSDQALALLADATPEERQVLGAIGYQPNRAVLHSDSALLPARRRAWAAWNYERATGPPREQTPVCLHYLVNRLQRLPFCRPGIVSLNPVREPAEQFVHGEFHYRHPVFDRAAIAAQRQLPSLQGRAATWFCGAWTRYGFHEDGLVSGLAVAEALGREMSRDDARVAA